MRYWATIAVLGCATGALAAGTSELAEGPSGAAPWSVGAKTHVLFSNESDPENAHGETRTLLNETDLRAERGRYSLGVRFDDRWAPDPQRRAQSDRPIVFEKASAAFEGENWQVKLGDSYQELGRGIALSLYRDPVFGLDTTLQGASARYSDSRFDVSVLGGRVHTLQVPVAINPQPNPLPTSDIYLVGGAAKVTVAPDTKLEGHYLVAKDRKFGQTRFDQGWNIAGGSFQADGIADRIDLYAEANVLNSQIYEPQKFQQPAGYGNYASAAYSAQPWKIKVEVKDYRQFEFGLNRPPTMEDDVVPTLNTNDVSAGRLHVERRLGENPNNLLHASMLYGWDNTYSAQVNHAILGGKFEGPASAVFEWKTGYRWLPGNNWMAHALFKGKVRTFKGQSAELGWRKWYYRYSINIAPTDDDHNAFDFAYVFSERYALNLGYEFVPTVFADESPNFFNIGGTLKLGALSTRVFVGRTSGGFICSGGVCRQVPPYTGAYLDATYTF